MGLFNQRIQRAVGQGFFHTAALYQYDLASLYDHDTHVPTGATLRLRYVYDCGSKALYKGPRQSRIDEFLTEIGSKASLDLLFLSHVHEDHINGVEQLLNPATGASVDTIVLPLINVEDRLIAFARSIAEDTTSGENGFYKDFIVNPIEALTRFHPRQIIFIRSTDGEPGAPGSTENPIRPLEGGEQLSGKRDGETVSWKLVGHGFTTQRRDTSSVTASSSGIQVAEIPDSAALAVPLKDGSEYWLLAPFVDPTIEDGLSEFLECLAHELSKPTKDLTAWLQDTANIRDLVEHHPNKLKAAYGSLAKDLNITSMSLYSGPARITEKTGTLNHFEFGEKWHATHREIAWLATGDAELKNFSRRNAFLSHYGALLKQVVTLTMPHHGSDHNFHVDILTRIQPTFCVVAADKFLKWNHPGPHVVQSIASQGLLLAVVTSHTRSHIEENAYLEN